MLSLFVNSEGGLTTAGYVLSIGVMVVCVLAGLALSDRTEKNRTFSARRLAYCAMAVALAYGWVLLVLLAAAGSGGVLVLRRRKKIQSPPEPTAGEKKDDKRS